MSVATRSEMTTDQAIEARRSVRAYTDRPVSPTLVDEVVRLAFLAPSGSLADAWSVIVVREPDHPVTKGLPKVFMHSPDELYSWLRGPAKNVTVLATAYSDPEKRGSGEHEPMLMDIRYGKGRVFHTAIGHAGEQLASVAFIVTFLRGAEWAATGKVTIPVPKDFPTAEKSSSRE